MAMPPVNKAAAQHEPPIRHRVEAVGMCWISGRWFDGIKIVGVAPEHKGIEDLGLTGFCGFNMATNTSPNCAGMHIGSQSHYSRCQ